MSVATELKINFERLRNNIDEISQIGRSQDHGIYRQAFTENDLQARNWLSEKIKAAGLESSDSPAPALPTRAALVLLVVEIIRITKSKLLVFSEYKRI